MTVKEIKEMISNMDDNATVVFGTYGMDRDGYQVIKRVDVAKIFDTDDVTIDFGIIEKKA